MTKLLPLLAAVSISALSAGLAHAEDITIKLSTLAERGAPARITNIEGAAEIMNQQFAAAGVDKHIVIDVNNSTVQGWDDLALETLKAKGEGLSVPIDIGMKGDEVQINIGAGSGKADVLVVYFNSRSRPADRRSRTVHGRIAEWRF